MGSAAVGSVAVGSVAAGSVAVVASVAVDWGEVVDLVAETPSECLK